MQIRFQEVRDAESVCAILQGMKVDLELRDRPATVHGMQVDASLNGHPTGSSRSDATQTRRTRLNPMELHSPSAGLASVIRPHTMDSAWRPTPKPGTNTTGPKTGPSFVDEDGNALPQSSGQFDNPSRHFGMYPTVEPSLAGPLQQQTNGEKTLPSEIASSHVPPERPLPFGFPERPKPSLYTDRGGPRMQQNMDEDQQRRSSPPRPHTRSQSSANNMTGDRRQALHESEAAGPQKSPVLSLSPQWRFEPPKTSAAYRFQHRSPNTGRDDIYNFRSTLSPEMSSSPPAPPSRQAETLQQHSGFLADPATAPRPDDAQRLERYAAQGDEQCAAALDHFIVSNLQNDDFLKLCEDTEGCWRRTGLAR
ncbi:hypothetical protein ANO11243_023050 [Dothideomycetidae sp. 11243]|nr:hypothetical protein ANO11243_023050 [fungal sp. No.11243]